MQARIVALVVAGVGLLISTCLSARAAVNPSLFQALQWRLIGPFRGGRVLAVAGIAGDPRHFYFGAVDGGVWATEDAGRTWRPIFDHESVGSIGAIAIAPSDSHVIYVGTGESDMRSDIAQGDGMYKSTDGGAHWMHIGLANTREISRVLVEPRNPNIVFVAALGHPYGPNAERGVFRSLDGGRHWAKVLYENASTGAADLAFKPGDPRTIYAALWQTRRPPWNVYPPSDGPASGLYVSHDGGNYWIHIEGHGFPIHPGRIGLAVARTQPDRVYAIADGHWRSGGLYRSDDGGRDWKHVSSDPRIWKRCWYFCSLTVDPTDANRVYVMDTIVLESKDAGRHFIALKGDQTGDDFHQLWIDPTNTQRQILGSDQGAAVTLDGGKTWSSWYNQPTAQIYHVGTDNRFPYHIYATQQDSGAFVLPNRSDSVNGITMQQFHEVTPGSEKGMIAADPDHPDMIYGDEGVSNASVERLNRRTGQTQEVDPTLAYPWAHYRVTWTLPLIFSKCGPDTLYFANQRLFSTVDGGLHWTPISPDLTRNAGISQNLDPSSAADDYHLGPRRGVIYTIAPSPLDAQVIWLGTDDGLVWRSGDGGAHWYTVTPPGLSPWSKIAGIEVSHFHSGVAYVAVDRHRLDDDMPYIYVTRDDGKSWGRIDSGIPRGSFVNVVREDPVQPDLLYAGTETGAYVSFNDGKQWQSLQQNLPVTSVRDIEVHGDDLVIGTHGRGIWLMDDISALRQMSSVHAGEVTLFKPAIAIRMRLAGLIAGPPMPKDEPLAANPPDGAVIDYILPAAVEGPVTVTILDAKNRVVRTYSSAEQVPAPNPYKLKFAPAWVDEPAVPSSKPGMQRFVWDLRYPEPQAAGVKGPEKDGVWAPPGTYTVRLNVMGREYSQPLLVKADPRVQLSEAGFVREFQLARKVEFAHFRASQALDQATRLLDALSARLARAGAAHVEITAVLARATAISGARPHPEREAQLTGKPPRRTDSLQSLWTDLAQLEAAVDGADADPGPDARASFAMLSSKLNFTLSEWRNLINGGLPTLEKELKAAGEPPIVSATKR